MKATQAAIAASVETPGLMKISAGNYGGRLGKSFIYLDPDYAGADTDRYPWLSADGRDASHPIG